MSKIGRNDPCSCGSGRKYKKCCLQADIAAERSQRQESLGLTHTHDCPGCAEETTLFSVSPYIIAKLAESSPQYAKIRRDPKRAARWWVPGRLARMETDEIIRGLARFGIDGRRERIVELAADRYCAWSISDVWRAEIQTRGVEVSQRDDFLGLAACELWKRFCPERPSIEMLDDEMQEGYALFRSHQQEKACERWLEVWRVIEARLRPEMRTCKDASVVFAGTQWLSNWLQDFVIELQLAAHTKTRFADAGVLVCEAVLRQFPDEDELFRLNFHADLAELLFLAGKPEEGERVLNDLIADHPDQAIGYVRLADLLGQGIGPEASVGRRRAIATLEKALAIPVRDADDFDVEARLAELRAEIAWGEPSTCS